jgi:hypothetical protein
VSGYLIVNRGLAGPLPPGSQHIPPGMLLASFNPEGGAAGLGRAEWTTDPAAAMVFASREAAHACWEQVSQTRPGLQPLTAFNVAVIAEQDAVRL